MQGVVDVFKKTGVLYLKTGEHPLSLDGVKYIDTATGHWSTGRMFKRPPSFYQLPVYSGVGDFSSFPNLSLEMTNLLMNPELEQLYSSLLGGSIALDHAQVHWLLNGGKIPWHDDSCKQVDLAAVLGLGQTDYEGGTLRVGDEEVHLNQGDLALFTPGTSHQVLPVHTGERKTLAYFLKRIDAA